MSTLAVNQITTQTGDTITLPTGKKIVGTDAASIVAPGHVVQVVHTNPDTYQGFRYQSTATSFADTGLVIQITPKFSNSTILVQGSVNIGIASSDYNYLNMKRQISGGSVTDLGSVHTDGRNFGIVATGAGNSYGWQNVPIMYPDYNHGTTSQISYTFWMRNNASSGTHYVGWTSASTARHNNIFLTATEFAQ